MSGRYAAGEKVLFVNENAGGHLVGIVLEEVGKGIKVKTTSGNKDKILIVPFKNILRDCPVQKKVDVDNMILLTDLSAFTILENLKYRYYNSKIYTYIGNIVITVNPYKDLLIDGPEVMLHYFNHLMSAVPPHLYGLAELIYQAAVQDEQNQVVIISGESGSGKTEAFKRITRYLAVASEPRATSMSSVARRVLDSTPVLESFGNATTLRNDNSSRFGKYVEIYFANAIIIGAKITNFLLEKSRIVRQSEKERNYHVFYEFLSSLDNSNKQLHHLQSVEDYDYLVHGQKLSYTSHSDPDGLAVLLEAWRTLGLPTEEIDLCLRIISAILHLGNLKFVATPDGEKCNIANPKVTEIVASELGVNAEEFNRVITMKLTETTRESLWSPVRDSQARVNRDSIAKHIYSEFFDRLVAMLNDRLSPPSSQEMDAKTKVHTVGLLDIYGFENFPNNSLEQLCINYTNENLQRFFNFYIFELEQEEYVKEGIDWQYIKFPDNQPIITLIAGKPNGIFHICNDEASMAAGTDESFMQKCQYYHRDHPNFEVPRLGRNDLFVIVHFAGQINYNIHGFVDKNRDHMRAEVLSLLTQSKQPAVASMFRNVHARRTNTSTAGPRLKSPMVLATFNSSLQELMEKMKQNQPHFVRCIKPNMDKQPMVFEDSIVLDQLRYTGVLEATRIRKSGFPVRPDYEAFVRNYGFLLTKEQHQQMLSLGSSVEAARYLLSHISISIGQNGCPSRGTDYEFGRNRLFMRNQLAVNLEAFRSLIQNRSARIIQQAWRRRGDGLYERARHNAAKVIQSYYRGYLARRQNPDLAQYMAGRMVIPQDEEKEEQPKELTDLEILRLEIPSDLAYVLEERSNDQRHWLAKHRVTKPRGSIRRLLQSHYANGWQTYGRPVWDAQPLVYLVNTGRTTKNFGYRLAPRHRPILLTQATESQRAACVAASKLLLRLVHLPEQPIMEQFLMGSYLYQLALTHKSLQKELLVQMLSQTVDWPYDSARLQDSDKEDEESLFVTPEYASRNQPEMYSIAGGMLQGVIRDVNPIDTIDLKRRAYRRSWMHIAGILTCGRLSGTLKPIVVRFLRQHGPHRSIPICEDRLVLAPSIPRLYPPCLLEWRVNYTGNNMGISLAFPDGLVSVIHVGCFTKAETLAGVAMALRTRAVQALTGWTVAFYTPDAILDIPGYTYVMDVFSSFELPAEWSTLNNILPDHVFPTYPSDHNADGEFLRRTPTPMVDSRTPSLNGSPMKIHATNGFNWRSYSPGIDPRELANTIHGVETPVPEPKRVVGIPPPSPAPVRGSWSKAVRRMAQKRFPNISRSESQLRRVSSRRERQWRSEVDGSFPRPQSPGDILALARLGRGSIDSPAPADVSGTRKAPLALPHEMRYYTYDRPNWMIRLRKEHISPRERIRTAIVLNMVFIQVCQDALNPAFARLKPNERKSILEIIGDRRNHDNAEYLNQVPLETKKNVVMTSLNFQLYFGRFFSVLSLASPSSANYIHWLVVAHHGVRLVFQQRRSADLDIQATLTLGEITSVQTTRIPCIPGWRLGDTSVNDQSGLAGTNRGTTSSGKYSNNMLIVTGADKEYRLYSDTADRICEMIRSFVNEYNEEMARLKEAAERRVLRSALRGTVTPDSPRPHSTPEVGFRYVCSPPLLANVFPQRDVFTPLPESSSPSLKSESPVLHKPPVSPKRLSSNSPTLPNQDSATSRFPQTRSAISGQRRPSAGNPKDVQSNDRVLSTSGGEHTNGSVRYRTDSPAHVEDLEHHLEPPGLTQATQHALLPFADQHFAQKVRIVDQLSWDPSSERFLALLHHTNSADVKTAQNTFSLILQFCGEEMTSDPPHTVFRQLVETLWNHPQLSDEVYCQLVKQTYQNRSSLSNGNSAPWLLWALVSIFVPTTDELRPYLVRYVNDNSGSSKDNVLGAAKETLSRSMELVAKFGPRKLLPPDRVLKALTSGELFHRQQVNLPNQTGLLATIGQLSLVRDVVRGLVEQLDTNSSITTRDFALYVAPKQSTIATVETRPVIPLNFDEYLLDFPVYNENNTLFFRRLWWTVPMNYATAPPPMLNHLFDQISEEYLSGQWIVDDGKQLLDQYAQISALMYLGRGGTAPIHSTEAVVLKPEKLQVDENEWTKKLNHYIEKEKSMNTLQSKASFLQLSEKNPLFGVSIFKAVTEGTSSDNSRPRPTVDSPEMSDNLRVLVGLCRAGVQIFDFLSGQQYKTYRFEEIASTRVNYQEQSDNCTEGAVFLTTTSGKVLILHLQQARLFVFILNRYQHFLSTDLLASE